MTNTALELELAYRAKVGYVRLSVVDMRARFQALGYDLDRSMDCRSIARYTSGEAAGRSYPCVTTGVKEIDTGRSAFHFQSRRDDKFRAMQELRGDVFAVSLGAILEA